ncbi:hypothetical protein [Moorena bouillonii]|uniref:hypothetical protein n=1 Tax=Moorena bouillonii TaxID=207920 RepID=UPI0018EA2E30|nr:hypothetical protein [Moorena bouillonii]
MSDCRGFPHERLHQDGSREKGKKIITIPTRIGIVIRKGNTCQLVDKNFGVL